MAAEKETGQLKAMRLDTPGRRWKILMVTPEVLIEVAKSMSWITTRCVANPLPADARVVDVITDVPFGYGQIHTRWAYLVIESAEYPPVPVGNALEMVHTPMFEKLTEVGLVSTNVS